MSPDPAEGQGLHSHRCPASSGTEGKQQHWCSQTLPYSPGASTLSQKLFLGLSLLFPALLDTIKHWWLPKDVRSQPCSSTSPGSLEENQTVLLPAKPVANCGD